MQNDLCRLLVKHLFVFSSLAVVSQINVIGFSLLDYVCFEDVVGKLRSYSNALAYP